METNTREEKGKEIALKKQSVTRIRSDYYIVKSQTTLRQYNVVKVSEAWKCSCPDHSFRHVCCKHIHTVEFSIKIRGDMKYLFALMDSETRFWIAKRLRQAVSKLKVRING